MFKSIKLVVAIFTNVLFVLGVVFLIVGMIQGIKFVGYKLLLDQYPTRFGGEDCSYVTAGYPMPAEVAFSKTASVSAEQTREQKQMCEKRVAQDRQVKQVDDLAMAVGMSLSGLVLIWLFNPKGRWAVKESK